LEQIRTQGAVDVSVAREKDAGRQPRSLEELFVQRADRVDPSTVEKAVKIKLGLSPSANKVIEELGQEGRHISEMNRKVYEKQIDRLSANELAQAEVQWKTRVWPLVESFLVTGGKDDRLFNQIQDEAEAYERRIGAVPESVPSLEVGKKGQVTKREPEVVTIMREMKEQFEKQAQEAAAEQQKVQDAREQRSKRFEELLSPFTGE
jgi:vacuolar-type H+-ATPase subunit I/STV1